MRCLMFELDQNLNESELKLQRWPNPYVPPTLHAVVHNTCNSSVNVPAKDGSSTLSRFQVLSLAVLQYSRQFKSTAFNQSNCNQLINQSTFYSTNIPREAAKSMKHSMASTGCQVC